MSSLIDRAGAPSRYLTDAYYEALVAWRDAASSLGAGVNGPVREECAGLLFHEARLLDTRRFADWLGLYTPDCIYWVPAEPLADPRGQVNVAFDDRRRLEDRIIRLETGFAHNQMPDRRMRRLVTNIEAFPAADGQSCRVLANEHVFEHRTGKARIDYVGGLDYWLVREGAGWKIKVKRVMLINSLDGLDTPTLL